MSDFKAKMHKIRFPLRLCSRPRWELTALTRPYIAVFKGAYFYGEGEGRGREREGKRG